MDGLDGRTFLVTGAASGIGRGVVERLVAAGGSVAMADRDAERLEAVAGTVTGPGRVLAVSTDVTDPDAVTAAVDATVATFGAIHGAVTSAGIFHAGDLVDVGAVDLGVFDEVLAVNLRGTVLVLRAVLPRLDAGGSVVTIASTAALRGHGAARAGDLRDVPVDGQPRRHAVALARTSDDARAAFGATSNRSG